MYAIELGTEKSDKFRIWIKGEAAVLMKDGEFNYSELRKNELDMEQVRSMLRQQSIFSIDEVKDLILEPGGKFSVNKYKKQGSVTPEMLGLKPLDDPVTYLLVDKGDLEEKMLERMGKSENWLREQLENRGYPPLEKLLYVEWCPEKGFSVKTKLDDKIQRDKLN
ncbi:DUF421 domain-containing protein [Planococcus lenghuensis]|uniref:DUF421 domain-containing protein n=1 Tax=Planococcus lenghuensis TaxID=2213202 RepID=UPI000986C420|nr:DUF421 domain-containing protein [Planococcus lenghuensis]